MDDLLDLDGDDLVRKTDLLIQQLAAARATSGVPDTFAATATATANAGSSSEAASGPPPPARDARASPGAAAGANDDGGLDIFDTSTTDDRNVGGCSIPREVTFGGGGEEEVSQAAASHGSTKGGGATLSTASTSFHAADDDDDDDDSSSSDDDNGENQSDSSSDRNNYQDGVPDITDDSGAADLIHDLIGVVSADVATTPSSSHPAAFDIARSASAASEEGSESPTQLKKKIMSKYGEGKKPSASVTAGKKKKNKKKEKSRGSSGGGGCGRKSSKREKRASTSAINNSTASADADGISIAAYTQRKQRQQEYGADYSSSVPPMAPQMQAQAAPNTTAPVQPTDQSSSYQTTTNQSLQEAMRQAEIAEDAARRMREAVATHSGQTMDRDGSTGYGGGAGGMEGFGSGYPQGFGGSGGSGSGGGGPSSGPRVGASFLETGATACIREMLRCLADPLEALANDNSAPPDSSVTGFGSMDDPHPRFARARGIYEYVPVPNIRHVGGNDKGGGSDRDRQSNDEQSSSERKGLLGKGTGYESNW